MPEIRTLKAIRGDGIRIVKVSSGALRMAKAQTAIIRWGGDPYPGPYSVTPSAETQILRTEGMQMDQNVVVNPIPSNYGRIAWDGAVLRIT